MSSNDLLQFIIYLIILIALAYPLGIYIARVFKREKTPLDPILCPVESFIYRILRINASAGMHWTQYAYALLTFNLIGCIFLYFILKFQNILPLNPQGFLSPKPDLIFNIVTSFITNTNWQSYSGEQTLSYFSQMAGLGVQNFLSAGVGICVALAMIRGFANKEEKTIGNFWFDITRTILWILIPLSIIVSIVLISQGVPQNFSSYIDAVTLEGNHQVIAQGPVASQEAIKMIGTNGGGFFNANSAHPYENPTPFSNFIEMLSILLIPAALYITFGCMTNNKRQGIVIFGAMIFLFIAGFIIIYMSEVSGNPAISGIIGNANIKNMEGKEVRFGLLGSSLFTAVTTCASCGAVNSSIDSYTPLGGLIPLLNIQVGEIIFGGAGSGLYGILLFVILTVFIAGLMVGRTPEFLGKKIEAFEMKMTMIAVIIPSAIMLLFTAISISLQPGISAMLNPGPHGFSEILYAFTSSAGNNGSAFGGISANSVYYNTLTAIAMLIGRFGVIIPVLAIAGSMSSKKRIPEGPGTFPTTGLTFASLLVTVIIIVGMLTFIPALSLGPIIEHLKMNNGILY